MDQEKVITLPRLYTDQNLKEGLAIPLDRKQAHYLGNVLRLQDGASVRLFNGQDGEWLATLESPSKKNFAAAPVRQIKAQPSNTTQIHLLFAPIKKHRMDILIEKSVELGVTDLHPVLTDRTEIRKLNTERLHTQIIESAEQCERLEIPALHPLEKLDQKLARWNKSQKILWGDERGNGTSLGHISEESWAFLIGPVGGFTAEEAERFRALPFIQPISLGPQIYRVETAAILCLSRALLCEA
ncbi:MAG: 16S rRNA (uracil(1498)-N(3))-methyltransferase [Alphaproteobacteria bacterium]